MSTTGTTVVVVDDVVVDDSGTDVSGIVVAMGNDVVGSTGVVVDGSAEVVAGAAVVGTSVGAGGGVVVGLADGWGRRWFWRFWRRRHDGANSQRLHERRHRHGGADDCEQSETPAAVRAPCTSSSSMRTARSHRDLRTLQRLGETRRDWTRSRGE